MDSDCNERHTLADIFGEETELVNIAKETSNGTINQRVQEWCGQNERNVYIGRGSDFGNPFRGETAIEEYRQYIISRLQQEPDLLEKLKKLKGQRLGCWCKPQKACHGDILLELIWDTK